MKYPRLLVVLFLSLGLTLALMWLLQGSSDSAPAKSRLPFTPPSLPRPHDPVVITAGLLSRLSGSPVEEIFVYAYQDTGLVQIPFQVDERNAHGMYVAAQDGQLNGTDELLFMAADAGGWVENPSLDVGVALITPTYVITLTDPISRAHAWVYVFHSSALSRTFEADYVSYESDKDRISGAGRYAIGFNAIHGFRDYLSLGDSDVDLLDRDKFRITSTVSIPPFPPFSISTNEQDVFQDGVHAVDGPVRVTRVSTHSYTILGQRSQFTATLHAYRSLVVQLAAVEVPSDPVQIAHHRSSVDWNAQAQGMVYYDANNPAGVVIDGIADVLTLTAPSGWTQVSSVSGTVVNVSQVPPGLGGTQSTYFKDSALLDSDDTGDGVSYGDAGFQVRHPNSGDYAILAHFYFLTGTLNNVGATCAGYYDYPLQVVVGTVHPVAAPPLRYLYMPLVIRG
jgi:hypothetical protein